MFDGRQEHSMTESASAWRLIFSGEPSLYAIAYLSLKVSVCAVLIAGLIGFPLGALLGFSNFRGRNTLVVITNALMGLPPVVVGLCVYLALSRSGPLGFLGLLFTPTAMVIAQAILITPIITALTRQTVEDLWSEYKNEFKAMGVSRMGCLSALLYDARISLLTALLAGFGRAAAEVGAVMIVGGNIDGFTRTMTTAIALETSKGDMAMAMGLGLMLIAIVIAINASTWILSSITKRRIG
jgi:tungstate transport system permease protein